MGTVDRPVAAEVQEMIQFAQGGIVSKTIVEREQFRFILFCMAKGQELSEHTASVPATIQVVRGSASVKLGETTHQAKPGSFFYMPAELPHAIVAQEDLVFVLAMLG